MKTKTVVTILLLVITLTSCSPTTAPVPKTFTPVPAATVSSLTEQPHIQLQQDTILYSGPGNDDFEPIATLKSSEMVFPLGVYVDFVRVIAKVAGRDTTGFIWKNDLGNLPEGLPELTADSVPWRPLFLPECSAGVFDTRADMLTFENTSNNYHGSLSPAILLEKSLLLRLDHIGVTGNTFGSVQLLGQPGSQDTWWKNLISMDVGYNAGSYVIFIRDGTGEHPNFYLDDLGLSASQKIQIVFEQVEGRSFVVLDGDNRRIRRIDLTQQPGLHLPNGLFPEGKVHIGTSTAPHSSLSIAGLEIGTLAKGLWMNNTFRYPGLAELAAAQHLTFGTEFSIDENADPRYCRTMQRDFNVAVINQFSTDWIWREGPGQYDFSILDREVDYAVKQGWRVRASHLIWGDSVTIPDWLKNGRFTRDEYIGFLKEYVQTVVTRYKGRVHEWSIANEAISRSCNACKGGTDFWNEKIGPEYIEMAFRWTREIDPDAILILNDTNNEAPRDSQTSAVVDQMYSRIKELKSKGVPVDVVGMEMHLLMKYSSPIAPKKDDVLATMLKIADLGVKIYITEFDVDIHNQPGTPGERLEFQAGLYRDMLEACLESTVCESFTTWGVSDSTSWLTYVCPESWCINQPDADPLMFDREYHPKPAYFAVRDVLQNFSTSGTP
jgi:endo-1,4-beta-xylanase